MATLTIPYSFVVGTTIVPSEMNSNFGAVKSFAESISAGTSIDAGAITSDKLASATVQLLAPTGVVNAFAGSAAPTGWLLCDGTAVSRATYAALFTLIGTAYGAGDGTTTFNLPNLKGRVPAGRDAAQTEFDVLGETGGAKTHALSIAELASHQHNITAYSHAVNQSNALGNHSHSFSGTVDPNGSHSHTAIADVISSAVSHGHQRVSFFMAGSNQAGSTASPSVDAGGSHQHTFSGGTSNADLAHGHSVSVDPHAAKLSDATGSGTAHNNLQPYLVVNYIIKT